MPSNVVDSQLLLDASTIPLSPLYFGWSNYRNTITIGEHKLTFQCQLAALSTVSSSPVPVSIKTILRKVSPFSLIQKLPVSKRPWGASKPPAFDDVSKQMIIPQSTKLHLLRSFPAALHSYSPLNRRFQIFIQI